MKSEFGETLIKVAPPPKIQLNKNNISEVQSAISQTFRESKDDNDNGTINKHYGKYYCIMLNNTEILLGTKWISDTNFQIIILSMFHGV